MPASGAAPQARSTQTQTLSTGPEDRATSNRAATPGLRAWEGLKVEAVRFEGVPATRLAPLPSLLELQPGQKLDATKTRSSLRVLYGTGLYHTIDVEGERHGDSVIIIFNGSPNLFVGRVLVHGVKNDRLTSQLQRSAKLTAGATFSPTALERADILLEETLQENGFYQAKIARSTAVDSTNSLIDVNYQVDEGKQARVGDVAVAGNSGMTQPDFRKRAKLKNNSKVNRDTVSRALSGLRKNYQKKDRLEANVSLQSKQFHLPQNHLDFAFQANQGPLVSVKVNGAKLSKGQIRRLIPVYEEGAVDDDLLNEGDRNLREHFQRQGYFDAKVTHDHSAPDASHSAVMFNVDLGPLHRVDWVRAAGNKYFDKDIVHDLLRVQAAGTFNRHGTFSQNLVTADSGSITALYQGNGFSHVKITPVIHDTDAEATSRRTKLAHLTVLYQIDEGVQQRIAKLEINGTKQIPLNVMTPMLNTQVGQPYSSANVAGDRDTILSYYLAHGFEHAQLDVTQQQDPANPAAVNIVMNVSEGDQTFVDRVLLSGLHYTRESTVKDRILIHPGDTLDQSALLEMQRRLYDLTLFNEVNTAVQNPNGDQQRKNVLVQFTEARRWDINYGFGFEVQTGNPETNCPSPAVLIQLGLNPNTYHCSPNGKFGASPRVLFDVSRINLRGKDKSISVRTAYGSLEQRATFIFSNPHLFNLKTFDASFSGGYTNSQDVTTYAASRLEGSIRVTEHLNRPTTLIYEFTYRRVKVDPNSVQVAPDEIPLVSEPVRVGGPGITWIRDTRDNPLDAHRGTYNTVQNFFAHSSFGSEANFNRLDATNSTYYTFGKRGFVFARSTRYAFERTFGNASQQLIPLPERLYAGGAQSLRGFSINAAGPRDPSTGFPIGGAAALVNSFEMRFPNPTLPYVGNSVGFVLFHDMGNVFDKASDIWPSFLRVRQPNSSACRNLTNPPATHDTSIGQQGDCSFNDFSHAVGLGVRYHTPIGPLRADFSYNLNAPIYPVIIDYTGKAPHVERAGRFNFFFSIGQSF